MKVYTFNANESLIYLGSGGGDQNGYFNCHYQGCPNHLSCDSMLTIRSCVALWYVVHTRDFQRRRVFVLSASWEPEPEQGDCPGEIRASGTVSRLTNRPKPQVHPTSWIQNT